MPRSCTRRSAVVLLALFAVLATCYSLADEHVIDLPPGRASGVYRFRVGVYNWVTGERLPASSGGQPAGSFVLLDRVLAP